MGTGAGTAGARGLLLTVLGEFVLPGDGWAWTSAVIEVLGRLEVAEKASRQALMRTAAAGWLTPEKAGRRTRWHLTGAARAMLTDGAERIYSFTGPARDWDGRWLLVSAALPAAGRRARHAVHARLRWAGFGSLGPGLWVSTHPEREAEVAGVLHDAGLDGAHLFVGTRPGLGDVRAMVAAAWDLAAIEREYGLFIAEFGDEACRLDGEALARQVGLVHAWRRFPAIDPALPRELLPELWSGLAAARLFADLHDRLAPAAQNDWKRLNADR
jgi:phenylacetic acid degradation operon negative regulatory protein